MTDNARGNEQVQEGARDNDGGKHTDDHAQEERRGKTDDDACAKVTSEEVENGTRDKRRDV